MAHGWTLTQMPRQDGRRALITGGNSGIGYATALELARHGATVVLACRNRAKAEDAALHISNLVPGATVEVELLDLSSLGSVRAFAEGELARPDPLDLLILNAGVYCPPRRKLTAEGLELQFGTNVVAHFALTGLLLPKLAARAAQVGATGGLVTGEHEPPRIITIASVAHKRGQLHWDDLQFERSYNPMAAYSQSKLADLMFSFELARRLRAHGSPILSVAAHPGVANTNLFVSDEFPVWQRRIRTGVGRLIELFLNSSKHGALPTLFAATAPEAPNGGYFGPRSLFETRGSSVFPAKVAPQARNEANAARLWSTCEQLAGVRYLD